ncbi:hypothetical protein [Pseudonocardia xinjiangensis]|uniref:Parallel beta helix pectate lyase-like protein n=1 Tax=Pseudonocardia xinjiangensis TaxID=75289 RepID=A0ABX1RBN7_9PSEU|nr:hypothetical protein [Pseudonocardia xinjiangensis]NMH77069.1 hypothetical protein [Pseudonocardia xinjiangensis]
MQGLGAGPSRVLVRAGLALATCVLAVVAVVVATEGGTFPGGPAPTVTLAPTAAVGCDAAGPYTAPERGSVGLPTGVSRLCRSGPLTVSVAGAVFDGWDVSGGIVIDAPDVVVRRSRVTGDSATPYGIVTTAAGSVRIEDVTLTGDFPEAAIGGDRWSGERIEIVGVTHDGAQLGDGARLRNSSVHDFAPVRGGDVHGLVLRGTGSDVLVEDNRIELGDGPGRGSALLLAPEKAGQRADGAMVIRGNVLGGGRYTVRQDSPAAMMTDVAITGNRFRRGAGDIPLRVSRRAVLDDNTYLDGGPLPPR